MRPRIRMIVEYVEVLRPQRRRDVEDDDVAERGRQGPRGAPLLQRGNERAHDPVAAQLEHDDAYAPEVDGAGMHQRVDEPVGLLVGRRGGPPRGPGGDPPARGGGEPAPW